MDRQLFRPEVVDKITSEHGAPLFLGLRQLSMLTWATMLALVIVCAGACLIPIRTLIPTPGVIVRDGTTDVAASSSGRIDRLFVNPGDKVTVGQPLFQISSDVSSPDQSSVEGLSSSLLATRRKLAISEGALDAVELAKKVASWRAQADTVSSDIQSLGAEHRAQLRRLDYAASDLKNQEALVANGFISSGALVAKRDAIIVLEQGALAIARSIATKTRELAALQESIDGQSVQRQQIELRRDKTMRQLDAESIALSARTFSVVTATTSGDFSGLAMSKGQFVTTGQSLGRISDAAATTRVELFIANSSPALPRQGMPVFIRLRAYPHQLYGSLRGVVSKVAGGAVTGRQFAHLPIKLIPDELYFRAEVSLSPDGIPGSILMDGMAVDADIQAERSSAIQWLFKRLIVQKRALAA